MTSKLRRALVALGLATTTLLGSIAMAPSASADPIIPINWTVDADTHLAGLDQDISVTGGSFVGQVDLGTGEFSGDLTLPPATTQVELFGLPLANAAFEVAPTGPATGTVDLATLTAELTASFDLKISYLRPIIFPINLVGSRCQTSEAITVTMSGQIDLAAGSVISGDFTIPRFESCGLTTLALNLLVPGPGNTFTATATPAE
jgi:hypothetical protein